MQNAKHGLVLPSQTGRFPAFLLNQVNILCFGLSDD